MSIRFGLFLVLFAQICVISVVTIDFKDVLETFKGPLTARCNSKEVSKDCMGFCTYDMANAFSGKNLKNLNPGWMLISSILPGKCYVSELGKIFPALINFDSTEQCCNEHRDGDAFSPSLQAFLNMVKFDRMPKISQIKEEPKHCVQKACSGNTFGMKVRDIIACENTFILSIMCYVSKLSMSVDNLKKVMEGLDFAPQNFLTTFAKLQTLNPTDVKNLLLDDGARAVVVAQLEEHKDKIEKVLETPMLLEVAKKNVLLKPFLNGTKLDLKKGFNKNDIIKLFGSISSH